MSVAVRNESGYPTREVARIVRSVLRDVEADDVDVIVLDSDGPRIRGRYSPSWRPTLGQTRERMRLWLPEPQVFPMPWRYYKRKRSEMPPPLGLRSWEEALVALAAHEGQHHVQTPRNGYGRPKPGTKSGRAAPRFREDECEWAAYRAVLRYRGDLR